MLNTPKSIKAVTTSDIRKNFKKIAEDINNYDTTVIVARPKDKNIVMISQREYDSWQETAYLLRSKANRKALTAAKASFKNHDSRNKTLSPKQFRKLTKDDKA